MRVAFLSSLFVLMVTGLVQAAPISVSSYTYAPSTPPIFFDDNGYHSGNLIPTPTELTDGVLGLFNFTTNGAAWVGWEDQLPDDGVIQPGIVFDLGGDYTLNSVSIHYYSDISAGAQIHAPDSVNLAFSLNNTFGAPTVTNTSFNTSTGVFTNLINLSGESARYVQMQFFNDGRWTFLSEISFDGDLIPPPPAPEPTSLLLLGMGGMGMAMLRRRAVTSRQTA